MPTVSLSPLFNGVQNFSAGGIPLSGGLLYTYLAGTTTPSPTYTDSTGATPNANPIVLDASGRPSSEIWILSSAYKFVLMDSLSNVIATYDNITSSYAYQPSGAGAVATTVQAKLRESVSVKDFGAVGDGVADDTAAIQAAINSGAGRIYFPETGSNYYKISGTITFFTYQNLIGASARTTRVVNTNTSVFAFKAVGVGDAGAAWSSGVNYSHGSVSGLDIRSRYGVAINSVNLANPTTLDYANNAAFMAANLPVLGFKVHECIFIEDIVYANGATWMAAQPTYNSSAIVPTLPQLYTAGIGVLFSNVYEGIVEDCTFLYYGCGVLLYGADISEVRNCRFGTNLRHGWSYEGTGVFPSGHQTSWVHNDMLSSYSIGGLKVEGAACVIDNNYFENTGSAGASTINYYIYDSGIGTLITSNRFDDYGSTSTTGPLMMLYGSTDGLVTLNRLLDNRPAGAGTLSNIELSVGTWHPSNPGITRWGNYQFVKNGTQFPRLYHPAIQYDLDGDSLTYFPLKKHRDIGFTDISGGGIHFNIVEFKDSNGLWYYNEAPNQNPHKFYPDSSKFAAKGGSLVFTITYYAKGLVVSPTTVGGYVKWVDGAGTAATPIFPSYTFATTTTLESKTTTYTVPLTARLDGGYFEAWLDPLKANTYGITIA